MAKTVTRTPRRSVKFNTNKLRAAISDMVTINGRAINKSNTTELNIMKGLKKLSDKGLANFAPDSDNPGFDLTGQATNLLNAMNVSVDTSLTKNLNLKDEQTDREVVANPNLQDQNIKNAKKELIGATDKFPCSDDSFYELDSAPDQFVQAKNDKILAEKQPKAAITSIGADLAGINLNSLNTVTAQFK
jgi:hypothetical protein